MADARATAEQLTGPAAGLLPRLRRRSWPLVATWAAVVVLAATLPRAMGDYWSFVIAQAAVAAIIVLSLTLLIGFAGQVSLAQSAFVGAGAYTCAKLHDVLHLQPWVAVPLAVGVGFMLGVIVGIPALRLSGMYLAISTFGLAVVADRFVFQLPQLGGLNGLTLARPTAPINLASNVDFAYVVLGVLGVVLFCLWRLHDSRTGWYLGAIRDDERAALMAGVDVPVYKLLVFGFSGALAALGGSLMGYLALHLNPVDFSAFTSISYLALAVVTGPRNLVGALVAGGLYVLLPQFATSVNARWTTPLQLVLPMLLVIGVYAVAADAPRRVLRRAVTRMTHAA